MKIFSAAQIKDWDLYTIHEQQISSNVLMERAANACYHWLINNEFTNRSIKIFCGKGNNGGDGLALARLLLQNNIPATTYILELGKPGSNDFQLNLQRLHQVTNDIHFIQSADFFPEIEKNNVVIDALFGSGLNRPLEGTSLQLIEHINNSNAMAVAIDIPSGLYCDKSGNSNTAVHAAHTLSFQHAKLAFLLPENDPFVGAFHLLDIGLSKQYEEEQSTVYEIVDPAIIRSIIKPRNKFAHKGNFGHAAIVAGSYGMMGAAVLASRACMNSGAGKLTCHIPSCGYGIMQIALPEAMCKIAGEKNITHIDEPAGYNSIGIGPGIGILPQTAAALKNIFITAACPLVLDADALNLVAADKSLLSLLPKGSVITPHIKEFERIFGPANNHVERLASAITQAAALNIYIVLKGHYTAIATPRGKVYFNSTGNAGMAKAGMGDTLTGILTGLLAQQYALPEAALLSVYIHGLAGDIAAGKYSMHSMQATDLINCIPDAWKLLTT